MSDIAPTNSKNETTLAADRKAFSKSLSHVEKAWRTFNLEDGLGTFNTEADYQGDGFIDESEWQAFYDLAGDSYNPALKRTWEWNEDNWQTFQERFNCTLTFAQVNTDKSNKTSDGQSKISFEEFKNAMGATTVLPGRNGLKGTMRAKFEEIFKNPISTTPTRRLSKAMLQNFSDMRALLAKSAFLPNEAEAALTTVEAFANYVFAGTPALDRQQFEDLARDYNLSLGMFSSADKIVSKADGVVEKEEFIEYIKRYFIDPKTATGSVMIVPSQEEADKILKEVMETSSKPTEAPTTETDVSTEAEVVEEVVEKSSEPTDAERNDVESLLSSRGYSVRMVRDKVLQLEQMQREAQACKKNGWTAYCFDVNNLDRLASAMNYFATERGTFGELGISYQFWNYFRWWLSQPGN